MSKRAALLPARWWLLVGSGLAACSGAHEQAQVVATAARASAATTNVPALLGLSIDELRQRLGAAHLPPATLTDPNGPMMGQREQAMQDSVVTFQTGGLTLAVSYDPGTRQVHDLLVLGHHEDTLMAKAALRSSASNYLVMPVFKVNEPNSLLGLRVVAIK